MGFKDFLKRGTGLDLVNDDINLGKDVKQNISMKNKQVKVARSFDKNDEKVMKQLEYEVSRAIEKLEDIRDKLRVRRGY